MISINFTLFVQLLNFLVLVWIFNRIFIRPIVRNLAAKEQDLADRKGAVDSLIDERADWETAYQLKLKRVRQAAAAKREELLGEAKGIAEQSRRKAGQEAAEMMTKVRTQIRSSVEETRASLREKEEALAAQLTEAVLGRKA